MRVVVIRAPPLYRSPNVFRDLDDQGQFLELLVFRKLVAVVRTGKTTLRAETQVFKGHILGCFVDAALDVVFGFQLTELGSHHAEHDLEAFGHEPEGGEIPRAGVIIFQKEAVDLEFIEHDLGDGLIATLRVPPA